MPTISGKALGRKKPLFADFAMSLPPEITGTATIPLRRLIEVIVRGEVAAFQERQTSRRLVRALTSREIEEGAGRGKIDSGASEVESQPLDAEAAVNAAWTAYQDGLYLVAIDEQQPEGLDAPVALLPDSRVTFIRLTLLAGG